MTTPRVAALEAHRLRIEAHRLRIERELEILRRAGHRSPENAVSGLPPETRTCSECGLLLRTATIYCEPCAAARKRAAITGRACERCSHPMAPPARRYCPRCRRERRRALDHAALSGLVLRDADATWTLGARDALKHSTASR